MVQGFLKSLGFRLQRRRVRASIYRVDPHNSRIRWAIVVSRRAYSVQGPNSLWHIDGHHNLVNWGFVIHGGIDGFSRLIVYLHSSNNNRMETVTHLFRSATERYDWPSRVRSDHGGENVGVWQLMEEVRGPNRESFLAGTSVHNQRIDRLAGCILFLLSYFLLHISGHGGVRTTPAKQQFAQVCTTLHFYPQNK